ncbi:MAG: hypothetical protein ACRD3J_24260 [Thermoanaerobaculia bacterium]
MLLWDSGEGAALWSVKMAKGPVSLEGLNGDKYDFVALDMHAERALMAPLLKISIYDLPRRRVVAKVDEELVKGFVRGARPFLGVWRVADGKLVASFPTRGEVRSVGMAEDASRVTTADEAGFTQVWDLGWMHLGHDILALRHHACEVGLIATIPTQTDQLTDPLLRQTDRASVRNPTHGRYFAIKQTDKPSTYIAGADGREPTVNPAGIYGCGEWAS